MKRLLFTLACFFLGFTSKAQLEFGFTLVQDFQPGLEVGFDLTNVSDSTINKMMIQIRRTHPNPTPAAGFGYFFEPALQPGEVQSVFPFSYCLNVQSSDELEDFEVKITSVNQVWLEEPIVNAPLFFITDVDGCIPQESSAAFSIFCQECGTHLGVEENPNIFSLNKPFDVYNTMGELVESQITLQELYALPSKQLYILHFYTKNGYEIHKITIN